MPLQVLTSQCCPLPATGCLHNLTHRERQQQKSRENTRVRVRRRKPQADPARPWPRPQLPSAGGKDSAAGLLAVAIQAAPRGLCSLSTGDHVAGPLLLPAAFWSHSGAFGRCCCSNGLCSSRPTVSGPCCPQPQPQTFRTHSASRSGPTEGRSLTRADTIDPC